jgi:hypothetical protein
MRAPFVTMVASLLVLALGAAPARADGTPGEAAADSTRARPWLAGALRSDRLEHASLAFTLGLGGGLATRRPGVAFGVSFGLGVAKEARDARHGGPFDLGDLAADALGASLAALLTRALD